MENKANLFWAIVWTVLFILCVVGFFWNPSHFFTAAISALFAVMFWHDYNKNRGL